MTKDYKKVRNHSVNFVKSVNQHQINLNKNAVNALQKKTPYLRI